MNNLLAYPPQIEGKLPAFMGTTLKVPFSLSRAVSRNDFNEIKAVIKTINGSRIKYNGTTALINYDAQSKDYYATFLDIQAENLLVGQYYKVQIAFKNDSNVSAWSSVGIIKYTTEPTIAITNLNTFGDNINKSSFVGSYETADITEKVYSYCFSIYDEHNNLFESSGELIHNSFNDVNNIEAGVWHSEDTWTQKKTLKENMRYKIVYTVYTINNLSQDTVPYIIKNIDTIDARIEAKLIAAPDFDNGCINLKLVDKDPKNPIAVSGDFVISRYSSNDNLWYEVFRFNLLSQIPSEMGLLWTDYTIEHGVKYTYAL